MEAKIDIVMSTFNGRAFLLEQIASIQGQTEGEWRLLVRDDGSSDGTTALVAEAAAKDPRIVRIEDGLGNLGIAGSYSRLLLETKADFVALCDQDDIWEPNKLETCLGSIGAAVALQHDAELVGATGSAIGRLSDHVEMDRSRLQLLFRPNFVGCCMVFRRELLDTALPIPRGAAHDTWIGLVGNARGGVVFIPDRLIRYRRHASAVSSVARDSPTTRQKAIHLLSHLCPLPLRLLRRRREDSR